MLQSMGLQRAGHDLVTEQHHTYFLCPRKFYWGWLALWRDSQVPSAGTQFMDTSGLWQSFDINLTFNCGAGEDSSKSLEQQGDLTSQS